MLRPPSRPVPSTTTSTTRDRKSTRLNSSHVEISYAVFCLKKKTHELQNRRAVDFADFPIPAARRARLLLHEAEILGAYPAYAIASDSPRLARMLDYSHGISAVDFASADRVVDAAVLKSRSLFADVDVLFTPTIFFFNDTATTEIYTLSLHDALPISTTTSTT